MSLYVISVSAHISQISVEFKIGNRGCQPECMGLIQISMDFHRYPWMFGRYPRTSQLYSWLPQISWLPLLRIKQIGIAKPTIYIVDVISVCVDVNQISLEFWLVSMDVSQVSMDIIQVLVHFYRYHWMFGRYTWLPWLSWLSLIRIKQIGTARPTILYSCSVKIIHISKKKWCKV